MKAVKQRLFSPIKYFGGKSFLCKKIIKQIEYRPTFVEGFTATGIVSLSLDEVFDRHICVEKNPHIVNFWKVLRVYPSRMYNFLLHTDYSEENFETAKKYMRDHDGEIAEPFFHAVMYLITNRMSRSADMTTFGWSDRLRRGMPEYISAYKTMIESLPAIARRISKIDFVKDDYMEFMVDERLNENSDLVQYLDPPYVHSTRTDSRPYGAYEMKSLAADCVEGELSHEALVRFLKTGVAGLSYLSGYHSEEYSQWLKGYEYTEWTVANSASQSKTKKPRMVETLWKIG